MTRLIFLLLAVLFPMFLAAQQPENIYPAGYDTLYRSTPRLWQPEMYSAKKSFSDVFPAPFMSDREAVFPDFSKYLRSNWTVTYSSVSSNRYFPEFLSSPAVWLPLGATGTIFNEATYRVNNKLKVRGNSFGINSLYAPLLPRPGTNQWEIRGASVFMEYKVSKNVRFGAGISISESPMHP